MSRKEFLGYLALGVGSIFGITGLIRELASRASTPTAATEAESGTISSGASVISDSSASGSKAVKFSSGTTSSPKTFTVSMDINVVQTTYPTLAADRNAAMTTGWGSTSYGVGPHVKFFNSGGPSGAVDGMNNSGWGNGSGETFPIICFKRLDSTDQAYLANRASSATEDEGWCFWQEPEDDMKKGNVSIATYQAAYRTMDAIRKNAGSRGSHIKLVPCLMNYQEVDAYSASYNVKTIITNIVDIVDVLGTDCYRSNNHAASQTPAYFVDWIINFCNAHGLPWACTETGFQQCGSETKTQAKAWVDGFYTYIKNNGCQWTALWGPGGIFTDDTICATPKAMLQAQAGL